MSEGFKAYVQREEEVRLETRIVKIMQDSFLSHAPQMTEDERMYIEGILQENGTNSFAKFAHLKKYVTDLSDVSKASMLFVNDVIGGITAISDSNIILGAAQNLFKKIPMASSGE